MRSLLDALIGGLLAIVLGALWLVGAGAPLCVLTVSIIGSSGESAARLAESPLWDWGGVAGLLAVTLGWSAAITIGAAALGVPLGLALARCGSGLTSRVWSALAVGVLCIPPYLLYWVWGLIRLPGSPLGEWARISPARVSALQVAQLWWGLVCWTWPLIALVVAAAVRARPEEHDEMLRLDGVPWPHRIWQTLAEVRPALLLGAGLALLSTLTGFAAFDLAATSLPIADTYGSIIRRIRFEIGPEASMLAAGPLILASAALAGCVMFAARRSGVPESSTSSSTRNPMASLVVGLGFVLVLLVPVGVMIARLGGPEPFTRLGPLEGRAIAESLSWALGAGVLLAMVAIGHAYGWSHPRSLVRRLSTVSAAGWILMGVLPAAARGAALLESRAAIDRYAGGGVYPEVVWLGAGGSHSLPWPVLVIVGYIATYSVVSILIAWWVADGESVSLRSARLLDGAVSLTCWVEARGWGALAAAGVAGLLGGALALGEVSTTMIVLPPGPQSLTQRLLNKMHYAYEDSALATCLMLLAVVVPAGFVAAMCLSGLRRAIRPASTLALFGSIGLLLCGVPGCERQAAPVEGPFEPLVIIGSTGRAPGQFVYPRGMAFDSARQCLHVVDKSGRIQRFDEDGRFLDAIVLPKFDRGYPTGLSIEPTTGRLFVADTHEHRVLIYDSDGRLVGTFGSEGEDPGQMLYPTDVAFGPDGLIFVSEYGGNDRIQVFDAEFEPLYAFGTFGFGPGEFNRPQSIEYDAARDELVILDACNHRIVITDRLGNWKDVVGSAGRGRGNLSYPYGLVLNPDGSYLVSEFGNSRVQHLARDGTSLGLFGITGSGPGELQTPWGLAAADRRLLVVDSRNDRVQAFRRP